MTQNSSNLNDRAQDFFDELREAVRRLPDYVAAYTMLGQTFRRLVDRLTRFEGTNFVGVFAKTDYLLKHHDAPLALRQSVNTARVRLRNFNKTAPTDDLKAHWNDDLEAVAAFVALLFGETLPPEFHTAQPRRKSPTLAAADMPPVVRFIVASWDKHFIYGRIESGTAEELRIDYTACHNTYAYDWTYIAEMLYEGVQLNLVGCHIKDGTLHPELIILEPDYLVDISAVAACFEAYSESPLLHLLSQIRPRETTQPILLGNLAGQLLDEAVHEGEEGRGYKESATEFFKNNALALLTASSVDGNFHSDAQKQGRHIRQTVYHKLPTHVKNFDRREIVLEPSFFCEMLGLQGRMDFLQLDQSLLIEQKSGKSAFPEPKEGEKPLPQEKHYVQMLLYMELLRRNFSEQYDKNHHALHAFLLYSRYEAGLCGLGFAPGLFYRALRVRNGIARMEKGLADGESRLLDTLTAESLNTKRVGGKLWELYQKPQLEYLLAPLRQASPLERNYYHRFMTFIAKEHLLSKLGNKTKENSGFAAKWHDTTEEKQLSGSIFCGLKLIAPSSEAEGKVSEITLQFAEEQESGTSDFRSGDIVILYPYNDGETPDVRRSMTLRCTVKSISAKELTLQLRAPQGDSRVFRRNAEKPWAVEHDFFESSYGSLYRGLHAFLSAPKERRDLLLMQREPAVNASAKRESGGDDFEELTLRCRQAQDFFLVIGPPGTGKTSHGLMSILRDELAQPESTVLLLSYTNRAVDEICARLDEAGIDFVRIGSRLSCAESHQHHLIEQKVEGCRSIDDLRRIITDGTRVFVGTTTAVSAHTALLRLRPFSLAIIDEASQILEPHLLGLLSASNNGVCAIRKFVLIGDHKQLPAVVQQLPQESNVEDETLREIGLKNCRLSLFERLLSRYRHNPNVTFMLRRQGRMHRDIAIFPNEAFYGGTLLTVPLDHQEKPLPPCADSNDAIAHLIATQRIAFIDALSEQKPPSDKVNLTEASIIAEIVKKIYDKEKSDFCPDKTVGVIVPYRNQITAVRNAIAGYGIKDLENIAIDTVERYQGSQRDYIIYGFTVSKRYQLDFLTADCFEEDGKIIDRKLNVAMTRARKHLFLMGNAALLSAAPVFNNLFDFLRQHNAFFSTSEIYPPQKN